MIRTSFKRVNVLILFTSCTHPSLCSPPAYLPLVPFISLPVFLSLFLPIRSFSSFPYPFSNTYFPFPSSPYRPPPSCLYFLILSTQLSIISLPLLPLYCSSPFPSSFHSLPPSFYSTPFFNSTPSALPPPPLPSLRFPSAPPPGRS